MSSSAILRKLVFEDQPAVIDNEFFEPLPADEPSLGGDLAQELQFEHPDAAPDDIEDAIQEALEQAQSAEFRVPTPELELADPDLDLLGSETSEVEEPGALSPEFVIQPGTDDTPPAAPIAEAHESSAEILETARREAQRILAEADERAAEIERAAYEKGHQEGLEAGRASGQEEATQMVKQVVAIVDQATELHDNMLAEAEPEMVALCLEIARKVIHSELQTNPEVVNSVLADAVKKINGSPRVTVKVNPGQVERVRAHWETTFGPDYREKEWTIEGDPSVAVGGCVLDTKYGSIDARVGTQFEDIQKTFALLLGTDE